jgi:hypothetical protein
MSMDFLFLSETLGNCSEVKAGPRALPSREKTFPEQGHMTAAYLRLCSLSNTVAVSEIVSCLLFNRLQSSDTVSVNLWSAVVNLYPLKPCIYT